MPKTATEVCEEALRIIGVLASDEPATSEDVVNCKRHMDGIYADLDDTKDLAFTWTVETLPDGVYLSFARAVGGSVASFYGRTQRAAEAAMALNPRKTLYEIGVDGIKEYEARALTSENHTVTAEYF